MAHYKMMEKADRDRTQAEDAEDEFQTFLLKYPQSPLVPGAEQKLRDVQEVLADSQYRVARLLLLKAGLSGFRGAAGGPEPAVSALQPERRNALDAGRRVFARQAILKERRRQESLGRPRRASATSRIVTNYPLSKLAPRCQEPLDRDGNAGSRARPECPSGNEKRAVVSKSSTRQHAFVRLPMAMVKSMPDVAIAAHSGQPNLNPPDDAVSATDVLKPGAQDHRLLWRCGPAANRKRLRGQRLIPGRRSKPFRYPPIPRRRSRKQPRSADHRSSQRSRRRLRPRLPPLPREPAPTT